VHAALLTGQTEEHLCSPADARTLGVPVHRDVVGPFLQLREAARDSGFDLRILSGFRSFHRQLSIWNRKAEGELPVLDNQAVPLDIESLSKKELVFAILRWSALPGASRHHWGTELDVFDAAARPEGYEVQLVPEEVDPGGMFGPLHHWLDERMRASGSFGFFRPYDRDRNGVAPERWHLSCAPVASAFETGLTVPILRRTVEAADLHLKEVVLAHLEEIFRRFVANTAPRPS
jgi:LAS superfamily LD-carboxypeptidase LdcB